MGRHSGDLGHEVDAERRRQSRRPRHARTKRVGFIAGSASLALSDAQLATIMRLSEPLTPSCRDALLRILAHELRGRLRSATVSSIGLYERSSRQSPVRRARSRARSASGGGDGRVSPAVSR